MKYYNNNNRVNYITEDFSDIFQFDTLLGKNLIEKINGSLDKIEHYINKKNKRLEITNQSHFNKNNKNLFNFGFYDGTQYYEDNHGEFKSFYENYSNPKLNEIVSVSTTLTPEVEFKNIQTKEKYLYFTLPYEFIKENVTRTITNTDLKTFYKFAEEFLESNDDSILNLIKLINVYDKKHPRFLKYQGKNKDKFQKMKKWRADFDINFFMSLYHFGIFNPIVHSNTDQFLWSGTHRLAYGASLKYNIPNFIHYNHQEEKEQIFYRVTPPIFNKKYGFFEFDLKRKIVSVCFIDEKKLPEGISCKDDGCDIQSFSTNKNQEIKNIFLENKIDCIIECHKSINYKLKGSRYIDDTIKKELSNFNIYNDFQLLNIFKNRNKNLYELKDFCKVWDFIGEYGAPVSITYPPQSDRNFYKGNYVYIEIPFGVYRDFIHGWTDDICTKYHINSKGDGCNCYICKPENKNHMTLKKVREKIRSSKKWKNKKNTISSSYETFLSIKYMGIQRPVMNYKTFLKRGVHRSLFLSETESDVPNLFKIDSKMDIHRIVSEKPYFNLKEYLILEINLKEKELSIYNSIDKIKKEKLLTKISYK